jgi:hypothetical protein
MREQVPETAGHASGRDESEPGALYIITLNSSTAPMALEVPAIAELAGLAVFRSKRVEDGRDRFRLHVGYFESMTAAEAVLPAVRRQFPAAWAGPAPTYGMGSLDDTNVAQFKFIKAPNTLQRDVAPAQPAVAASVHAPSPAPAKTQPAPVAQPSKAVPAAARATPAAKTGRAPAGQPATRRGAPQMPAKSASVAARPGSASSRPIPPRLAKVMAAATPVMARPEASRTTRPANAPALARRNEDGTLAPRQVLSLLEGSAPPTSARAAMQPRERAAIIGSIQRFAVQLIWSTDPLNLGEVPKLAIFDAYTLYKVQVDRAGRRWYGLRLGFFGDPVSARQVALYARSDFSAAAVVPVSDRECDRAAQAAIAEIPTLAAIRKTEPPLQLLEEPKPVVKPVAKPAVKPTNRRPEVGRIATPPKASVPAKPRPSAAPHANAPSSALAKSTRELVTAAMDNEPAFNPEYDDVNDSGVRHLAVTVVKKNSPLKKFFGRHSRQR